MARSAYFVINIDGDPDPPHGPRNDRRVLDKYRVMQKLMDDFAEGKGVICVHTSPIYRDRFLRDPFMDFWREWTANGGELALHPEEDLYATAQTRLSEGNHYDHISHMEPIISELADFMQSNGVPFAAYKGGFHGLTMAIVQVLVRAGIEIDLTGAPGIVWPTKTADWSGAPASAYYMSQEAYRKPAESGTGCGMFEIPTAFDGQVSDTGSRFLLNRHYLAVGRSTLGDLYRVWNAVIERGERSARPQIVALVSHTHALHREEFHQECAAVLEYVRKHGGVPVTAREAKRIYDEHQAVLPAS